jgi:hypothetical protein
LLPLLPPLLELSPPDDPLPDDPPPDDPPPDDPPLEDPLLADASALDGAGEVLPSPDAGFASAFDSEDLAAASR